MSRENLGTETLEQLFKQSNMDKQTKQKFLDDLDAQLRRDNHDMALDERLEIVSTCFNINTLPVAICTFPKIFIGKPSFSAFFQCQTVACAILTLASCCLIKVLIEGRNY